MDGVEVSVMACFINSCQCHSMHSSLILEGQSRVYHRLVSSCRLNQFEGVGMSGQMLVLTKSIMFFNMVFKGHLKRINSLQMHEKHWIEWTKELLLYLLVVLLSKSVVIGLLQWS